MAAGDFTLFDQFRKDLALKIHDLDNDTFKLGLITNAVTPAATTSDPRWGAAGSTNFATSQVTPGGNYTTGGPTLANPTLVLATSVVTWDADNVTITSSVSNPTNARWGIVYNDTATGKQACGFVDFGSVIDLSAGNFAANVNASGLATW